MDREVYQEREWWKRGRYQSAFRSWHYWRSLWNVHYICERKNKLQYFKVAASSIMITGSIPWPRLRSMYSGSLGSLSHSGHKLGDCLPCILVGDMLDMYVDGFVSCPSLSCHAPPWHGGRALLSAHRCTKLTSRAHEGNAPSTPNMQPHP